jgi:hypothetical protein
LEYDPNPEEEDISNDMDDVVIRSTYESGYEILGYQISKYDKRKYSEEDLDFLHFLNVNKFDGSAEFYETLMKKDLVKYKK